MKRISSFLRKFTRRQLDGQVKGASASLAEELFYDLYRDRKKVYRINFFRGIFFGAGSVLGGTIIVTFLVWVLSLFVNFPLIGQTFQDAQESIERRTNTIESQR